MNKSELRQKTLRSRRGLPPALVTEMSAVIRKNLASLPEFERAGVVAAYSSLPDEVQTRTILESSIAEGKRVLLPVVDDASRGLLFFEVRSLSELSPGRMGILEPPRSGGHVPLRAADVALVPLVAWDERGNRIGYGRGYFDSVLASRGRCVAIGLAFEEQLVSEIPTSSSDVPLDIVVTERRVVRFGRNGVR